MKNIPRPTSILPLLAALAIVLTTGCSTLHPAEETGLANQVAILGAYRTDYAKIDCQACAPCTTVKSAVNAAAAAGDGFNAIGAKAKADTAYLDAIDHAVPNPVPACGCDVDAAICPDARHALEVARANLSIRDSLNRRPFYLLWWDGILGQ